MILLFCQGGMPPKLFDVAKIRLRMWRISIKKTNCSLSVSVNVANIFKKSILFPGKQASMRLKIDSFNLNSLRGVIFFIFISQADLLSSQSRTIISLDLEIAVRAIVKGSSPLLR